VSDLELVADLHAELLEGPGWDARADVLVCVDILAGCLHRIDPGSGAAETIEVGQPVGAAVPREKGGYVVAVRDGVAVLDGELTFIADIEGDIATTLMNDAKCDPRGRLWAGTIHVDEIDGGGNLYRVDPDHRWERVVEGTTVSNGLGWSPDGSAMYYVDSPTRRIDVFDYDLDTGTASERRPFVEVDAPDGVVPDGLTVDAEGGVWVALWGGSAVRRYAPDGRPDTEVALPVSQVTSCCFGGAALDELYVTTAALDLSDEPLAGGLFRCRPGVKGLPTMEFAG
jgi:sugar lactone lactonase YvrE